MNPLSALLRLLLALSLVLGGWTAASAHLPDGAAHGTMAMPCHDEDVESALVPAHGHAAMDMAPGTPMAGMDHAQHGTPATGHPDDPAHAPNDCCGTSAACHAHCALGTAVPAVHASLAPLPAAHAALRRAAETRYAPPVPHRLIRPPISA